MVENHSQLLTSQVQELVEDGRAAEFSTADDLFLHFFKKFASMICKHISDNDVRICDIISEVFAASKLCPAGFFPMPYSMAKVFQLPESDVSGTASRSSVVT